MYSHQHEHLNCWEETHLPWPVGVTGDWFGHSTMCLNSSDVSGYSNQSNGNCSLHYKAVSREIINIILSCRGAQLRSCATYSINYLFSVVLDFQKDSKFNSDQRKGYKDWWIYQWFITEPISLTWKKWNSCRRWVEFLLSHVMTDVGLT